MVDNLADFFQQNEEFVDHTTNPQLEGYDLFSIFDSLENVAEFSMIEDDTELETSPKTKRLKLNGSAMAGVSSSEDANPDGAQRMSHITVERNRRKQMNEHLSVLRSLMPCFYVKKVC